MKQLKIIMPLLLSVLFVSCGGDDKSKIDQTITFDPLLPHNLSEKTFELQATASSGLAVAFTSSDLSTAIISGKTVTLLKKGTVTITAAQSGNDNYYEAPSVSRVLTINEDNNAEKKNQTITFEIGFTEWNYAMGELTLEATSSSGLPVTFTSNHQYVRINGNILKLVYEGTHYDDNAIITASQAGNDEYNAAPNVSRTLRVSHSE
jgi:hypothetical protein